MTEFDDALQMLASCPQTDPRHSHIDQQICDRLKSLVGKSVEEQRDELKKCLDDSAYCALASDFGMLAMNSVYKRMCK